MKKIKWYKFMVSMIVVVLTIPILPLNQIIFANDKLLQVSFSEELIDQDKVQIEMVIQKEERYDIQTVTLPSKEIIEKDAIKLTEEGNYSIDFIVDKNDKYEFVVTFNERVYKEKVIVETKQLEETYTYETTKIKKVEDTTNNGLLEGSEPEEKTKDTGIDNKSAFEVMSVTGEDYTKNTGVVNTVVLDNTSGTINAKSSANIKINLTTKALDGSGAVSAKKVWVGFYIELDRYSAEGGEWSFINSSYAWLTDLDSGSQGVTPKLVNGKWVLEGRALMQDNGSTVVPGNIKTEIGVQNKFGVEGEQANIKVTSWLYSNDTPENATGSVNIPLTSTPSFDIGYKHDYGTLPNDKLQVLSGYYNNTTGDFSIYAPADMSGYQFGRVYLTAASIKATSTGNEAFDHTKPITYDIKYKVTKMVNGIEVEDTDAKNEPVILAAKQDLQRITTSQLQNSIISDMTFGGLVNTLNSNWATGSYTFNKISKGLNVSLTLDSKDLKISNIPGDNTLVFVPVDKNDTADTNRTLQIEYTNFHATSYTGKSISDADLNNNVVKYAVSESNLDKNGDGGLPGIGREINTDRTVANNQELRINSRLRIQDGGRLFDYNINSVNVLMKFDSVFDLKKVESFAEIENNRYSGTVNVLYGIKEDGNNWRDEYEMNHTQDYELLYYDSLEEAKMHGEVIAVLIEFRGGTWYSGVYVAPIDAVVLYLPPLIGVVAGESGQGYAVVQDIKIWRGSKKLTASDTYLHSNGKKVEEYTTAYSEIMVPYDNPTNTTGIYQKDIWNEGENFPVLQEGSDWGDTFFVIGHRIDRNGSKTAILNGNDIRSRYPHENNVSTYIVSNNERITDRVYGFDVTNPGTHDIRMKILLNENGTDKIKPIGKVYLSTKENPVTYIPNENPAKAGTFTGGKIIDPNDFTVPGEGSYQIYFSCLLGTPDNIFTDIENGEYQNWTYIELYPEANRYATTSSGIIHNFFATITKYEVNGINKKALSNGAIDEVGYQLSMTSGSQKMNNVFMLDVLPFNGDGRGSSFHGTYTIKDNKIPLEIQSEAGATTSKINIYYTLDEAVRTAGDNGSYANVSLFNGMDATNLTDEFTVGGCRWYKATENADGTWSIPEGSVPTAILGAGGLNEKEAAFFTIRLALTGQKLGDIYTNTASGNADGWTEPQETAKTPSRISTRTISGVAWADENGDELYTEALDKTLGGVIVKLYTKAGDEIVEDAEGNKYDVKTKVDGSYSFEKVPYVAEGYYVTFQSKELRSGYQPISQYASGGQSAMDKSNDNDTTAKLKNNLISILKSDVFTMKSNNDLVDESIAEQIYLIDAGVRKSIISFSLTTQKTDIVVPKDMSLNDVKNIINAKAVVTVDGVDTNISDTIDWDGLARFDTSRYGNTITFDIKVTNPVTGLEETKSITIRIAKAVVITAPDVNLVVADAFDLLKDVTVIDGDGNPVTITNANVVTQNVPMQDGKVTTLGNYQITYSYKDKYGHSSTQTRNVKVHGQLQFTNNERIDLLEGNISKIKLDTTQAFYINSDNRKINVAGDYVTDLDINTVGKVEREFKATHPINKIYSASKQSYYIHGDIRIKKPKMAIAKVGESLNILDGVSASYQHVNNDGTISNRNVDIVTKSATVKGTNVGYIDSDISASVTIVEGLSNEKTDTIRVGFNGYPFIDAASSLTYFNVIPTKNQLIKDIAASAKMKSADGNIRNLTSRIEYHGLSDVTNAGVFQVVLTLKDLDGAIVTKTVNITININRTEMHPPASEITPTPPGSNSPEQEEEGKGKDKIIVITKDIPLSKTEKGINEALIKQYISVLTDKKEKIDFEIISYNVQSKVGDYEVTIQLEDGTVFDVKLSVIDDSTKDVEQPEDNNDKDCIVHWIILLLFAGYSIYAIAAIFKRRTDNKNLEQRIEEMEKNKLHTQGVEQDEN